MKSCFAGRGVYVRFAHEISYCKQYGDIVFFKGSDIFAIANAIYFRVAKMCEKLTHIIHPT